MITSNAAVSNTASCGCVVTPVTPNTWWPSAANAVAFATHLIKKAGFTKKTAQAGAVTLIQRFGSALNLNIHFHMLFLDGVYVDRPDGSARFWWVKAPTSEELTQLGKVRYQLKTPYRDGTTHVIFEPLDFIARLAALVPRPRVNLTRFYGVFAPNSKYRALVTPAKRGKGNKRTATDEAQDQTPVERRASMTWAQRLKRVFKASASCSRSLPTSL